jgi:hypothetical protein
MLKPSREQALAGSFFGITATIENISDRTVFFTSKSFVLMLPPEIDPEGPRDWPAFFPLVIPAVHAWDPQYWDAYEHTVIPLPAKSTTTAMWNQSFGRYGQENMADSIRWFFRGLVFPPGKYTLTVVVNYWDEPVDWTGKLSGGSHVQTAEIQEAIGAPQSTVVFGAIVGGFLPFGSCGEPTNRSIQDGAKACGLGWSQPCCWALLSPFSWRGSLTRTSSSAQL